MCLSIEILCLQNKQYFTVGIWGCSSKGETIPRRFISSRTFAKNSELEVISHMILNPTLGVSLGTGVREGVLGWYKEAVLWDMVAGS